MADTKLALRRWNQEQYRVVGPWPALSDPRATGRRGGRELVSPHILNAIAMSS
jgi:hypothetical protein